MSEFKTSAREETGQSRLSTKLKDQKLKYSKIEEKREHLRRVLAESIECMYVARERYGLRFYCIFPVSDSMFLFLHDYRNLLVTQDGSILY